MKIICTQYQKDYLVRMMAENDHCILEFNNCVINCRECIENNIEWKIEGEEKNE